MKKLVLVFIVVGLLTACTSKTEFGDCVGIDDDQNPELNYKLSIKNLVLGFLFSELIIPPVVVLVSKTYCPVSKKGVTP